MATRTVYRYSNCEHSIGDTITPKGDSFDTLTDEQKIVEKKLRGTLPGGVNMRSSAIFTWADKTLANRLWPLSKKKYLYELEIADEDIVLTGDLNHYSDAVDAVKKGADPDAAIKRYCDHEGGLPHHTSPRIEILATKAKILKKHTA